MRLFLLIIIFLLGLNDLYSQDPVYVVRDTTVNEYAERKIYPAPTFTMGVLDSQGDTIIPFLMEGITPLSHGFSVVKRFEKYGSVDSSGKQIIPFVFDELKPFVRGRAVASLYDKWGIVDTLGNEIIPFVYEEISCFTGNSFIAKQDEKYGVVAIDQQKISPFVYESIDAFSEGVAVARKDGKKGIIDTLSYEKGVFMYEWIYPCSGGVLVAVEKGKYAALDKEGHQMTLFDYDEMSSFNKKGIGIIRRGTEYGIMNRTGIEIIPPVFEEITLYDDCAAVKSDNTWGVVDFIGNYIIPSEYQSVRKFYGDLFLIRKNWRWQFYDIKNKEEIPYGFELINSQAILQNSIISDFQRIYTPARRDGKWGAVDTLGQVAVPFVFEADRLISLGGEILAVQKESKIALSDLKGKLLSEYIYDDVYSLSENLTRVKMDSKYGVVDRKGNILHFCEYDGIYPLIKGAFYTIYKNGRCGIIDNNGKEIIPLKYAAITPFSDKSFVLRR
jgi:hypothetical protein